MHKRLTVAGTVVVLALVVAGCGGGGGLAYQAEGDGGEISLTMTIPSDGAWVGQGTVQTIAVDVSAATGVSRVEFLIDGVRIATDYSAPYSTNWDTTPHAIGSHTVTATAYAQGAPQTSDSQSISVNVWGGGGGPPPPPII